MLGLVDVALFRIHVEMLKTRKRSKTVWRALSRTA